MVFEVEVAVAHEVGRKNARREHTHCVIESCAHEELAMHALMLDLLDTNHQDCLEHDQWRDSQPYECLVRRQPGNRGAIQDTQHHE
ncbi:hypothetical protein D9M68_987850 [compost metagenome]